MGTPMESWPRRYRISVDEYHRMAEVGLLPPDARVELIEGEIIEMPPIGSEHPSVVDQLARLLIRAVGDDAIVRVQGSVRLSHSSEPQPDIALLKPRDDYYRHRFATGEDTLLVIEVSESTLTYDRDIKASLYARHGVPELWIVDLVSRELAFFRGPAEGRFQRAASSTELGVTAIPALPGVAIDLSGLL